MVAAMLLLASQWAEPPGAASPEDVRLLQQATAALNGGSSVSEVLMDPAFMSIHPRTEFRKLIEAHAAPGTLTLAGPQEPGTRLSLELVFKDQSGRPVADAVVYAYHTSAKGWYAAEGAHVRANSGDVNHARLFGYGRTDAQGKLLVRTIRPAGYPHSELPAHVHLGLTVGSQGVPVGEVRFDDDPRMTPEVRKESLEQGDTIVRPQLQPDGSQRCVAEFRVRVAGPRGSRSPSVPSRAARG
ncbi:MAG TPA: hypothetical protein VFO11_12975 [Candidatus Polarisedimenticolaceae bacterium]|nr:hypothetical protein [Candidatus Polarisedimenticolaceae bacterium]